MGDDRSKPDANLKSNKPPSSRQQHRGPSESGTRADELTPYRDRPSHDGKYGDAADEPASGFPDAPPEADQGTDQ